MLDKQYFIRWGIFSFFILYFSLFFFQKVNLTASDLGRHIQNGNVILATKIIFTTNFYSYTHPAFEVTNHHWLFGVFSSVIFSLFGYSGLTWSSIFLYTSATTILLLYELKNKSLLSVLSACFLCIPLLTYRTEFRPEVFSYLFLITGYITISKLSQGKTSLRHTLMLLLPLQIIWVNTHIFFIMIFGIVGAYGIQAIITKKKDVIKQLSILGLSLLLVSLCNPRFLTGLLEPLNIFQNYGYRIAENQGVIFLSKYSFQSLHGYFYLLISSFILLLLTSLKYIKNKTSNIAMHILCFSFIFFGFKMSRLLPLTGVFIIPVLSHILNRYQKNIKLFYEKVTKNYYHLMTSSTLLIGFFLLLLSTGLFMPKSAFGLGIFTDNNRSADFFKTHNLYGPIFNNYDIGGYLILHLYGKESVFVDNRPEAYPSSFFTDEYIPMQESELTWQQNLEKYNFNVIYFYRHDLTNWSQTFLINRVKDGNWVPVFVDDYAIIFVRNNEKNSEVIQKFRIPKEAFSAS